MNQDNLDPIFTVQPPQLAVGYISLQLSLIKQDRKTRKDPHTFFLHEIYACIHQIYDYLVELEQYRMRISDRSRTLLFNVATVLGTPVVCLPKPVSGVKNILIILKNTVTKPNNGFLRAYERCSFYGRESLP